MSCIFGCVSAKPSHLFRPGLVCSMVFVLVIIINISLLENGK